MNRLTYSPYYLILIGVCGFVICFSGCQSGLNGMPSLSTLNSPTRIPPPPTGAIAPPQGYGTPGVSGPTSSTNLKPVNATLAQLRSLETGNNIGDVFGSEGQIPATDIASGTMAARPVVAPPVSPKIAVKQSADHASKAAAVSFSQPAAPPVITASAINSHAMATRAFSDLPDPREGLADSHSEVSDGITWKTATR
ncbi:MAG: hypothetical protein NTW52_12555 [Planctomycetota bacterium]|nr:hypothetical protein [Planctomycetota bacterium]